MSQEGPADPSLNKKKKGIPSTVTELKHLRGKSALETITELDQGKVKADVPKKRVGKPSKQVQDDDQKENITSNV